MFPFNRKPVLGVLIVYAQDIKPAVCVTAIVISESKGWPI